MLAVGLIVGVVGVLMLIYAFLMDARQSKVSARRQSSYGQLKRRIAIGGLALCGVGAALLIFAAGSIVS